LFSSSWRFFLFRPRLDAIGRFSSGLPIFMVPMLCDGRCGGNGFEICLGESPTTIPQRHAFSPAGHQLPNITIEVAGMQRDSIELEYFDDQHLAQFIRETPWRRFALSPSSFRAHFTEQFASCDRASLCGPQWLT
jgi:hypothetical protein